jgi:vancomycin resistance protein YoaR
MNKEVEHGERESNDVKVTSKRVISLGRSHVIGLGFVPLLLWALLSARFVSSERVLSGVSIAGVPLGGTTAAEARRRLAERARSGEKLRFLLAGREVSLTSAELGVELDVTASVSRALAEGRSDGVFGNAWTYLRSWAGARALPAVVRVDRARFSEALRGLEGRLIDDPPTAAAIAVEQGVPRAVLPRAGRKISSDAALTAVSEAAAWGNGPVQVTTVRVTPVLAPGAIERALADARRALAAPVLLEAGSRRLTLAPSELGALLISEVRGEELELRLDAARFDAWFAPKRGELEAAARDATFEVSPRDEVKVVPSEPGVRLPTPAVLDALWAAALRPDHRGELPLLREPLPARSSEQAEQLGIRALVGSFTTRHPCCQPRVENIHRIASMLDGLVIDPGQTVSLNAVVEPRTQKKGFVAAPSIEDGEMVDTIGGGVSQFATTFFNAVFHAGYDIIERQPHTYWFPRYPMGHEATLGWPHPDIVFKNDSAAGLLIKTSFSKTTITVKLYGDTGGRRVSSAVSERRDIVQPAVELLPNRGVAPDEEKVKEGGMIGWSVIASRTIVFADGTKKEEKRKVTYKPKPRRVEVHPCRIPKGEPGASGEPCPEPEPEEEPTEPTEAAPATQPG